MIVLSFDKYLDAQNQNAITRMFVVALSVKPKFWKKKICLPLKL